MRRREFMTLVGGAAAWPLAARAQQSERKRRVGVLMGLAADDAEAQDRIAAFEQGLQQSGWTNGRNLQIDYRRGGRGIPIPRGDMQMNWSRPRTFVSSVTATLCPSLFE